MRAHTQITKKLIPTKLVGINFFPTFALDMVMENLYMQYKQTAMRGPMCIALNYTKSRCCC